MMREKVFNFLLFAGVQMKRAGQKRHFFVEPRQIKGVVRHKLNPLLIRDTARDGTPLGPNQSSQRHKKTKTQKYKSKAFFLIHEGPLLPFHFLEVKRARPD